MGSVRYILGKLDSNLLARTIVVLGTAILITVYVLEYLRDVQPCDLCLYQRWLWWLAVVLAVATLCRSGGGTQNNMMVGLACVTILIGAGVSIYHVGVEQHWWQGLGSCGGNLDMPMTLEALKKQIMSMPVVRCDDVVFSFLGVSMAGYNALISILVGGGGLILNWHNRNVVL